MHVIFRLHPGGMEHGVVKLVNGLDPARVQSSICSTTPCDPMMRPLVGPHVPVFELARTAGNDPRLVGALVRLFRRERPDVVHTHAWGTLVEGNVAARLAGVPVLVHGEHGTLQVRAYQRLLQRVFWQRADHLLSVSSRLAERMSAVVGVARERIRVIRNGVHLDRFGRVSRADARARLGLPADAFIVGAVGRLVPVKDHATWLDALAHLKARGVPALGVAVGDGPERPAIEARIQALGLGTGVRLLGHRTDVEVAMAAYDVFSLFSVSEGMSNTILEAMASGVPVVATNVGGADEMVVDGETGYLVAPKDPAALADAYARLAADAPRRAAMGLAGQQRGVREFGIDVMLTAYRQFYELAAGKVA
jgi:sugar transferase (PEP-CTERM/EpsH1 system associated)